MSLWAWAPQPRRPTEQMLQQYVEFVRQHGRYAEYWLALGTDAIDELEKLCQNVQRTFRRACFFAGKLVFSEENFLTRQLHNQASMALQRRLQDAFAKAIS